MAEHPPNSSFISGVRTGGGKRGHNITVYRATEEETLKEDKKPVALMLGIKPISDKPICDSPFSQEGKNFLSKFKREGYYFCLGKEGCPLKL